MTQSQIPVDGKIRGQKPLSHLAVIIIPLVISTETKGDWFLQWCSPLIVWDGPWSLTKNQAKIKTKMNIQ